MNGVSCDQILWRIEQDDHVLAGSEDDRPTREAAVEQINGRILIAGEISLRPVIRGLSLLMVELKTFVLYSEEDARWQFRHGMNQFVPLGPNLVPDVIENPCSSEVADAFLKNDTD